MGTNLANMKDKTDQNQVDTYVCNHFEHVGIA